MVSAVGWLLQNDAVRSIKMFVNAFQSLSSPAIILTGSAQDTPALAFNKDFSFLIGFGTHRIAFGVISPGVPFPIPSLFFHYFQHAVIGLLQTVLILRFLQILVEGNHFARGVEKKPRDHDRLSLRTLYITRQLK